MSGRNKKSRKPVSYDLDIVDWDLNELRGVGRHEGKTIFAKGAILGEMVVAERERSKKNYEDASTVQVLRKSPLRIVPECPHFGVCGGCSLQHMHMPAQLAIKQRLLEEQFRHLAGTLPATMLPPIQGPSWGYRDRCRMSVKNVSNKGVLIGFREKRSGYVANMDVCPILPPHVSRLISPLKQTIGGMDASSTIPQIEWSCGQSVTVMAVRHMDPLSAGDLQTLRSFVESHSTLEHPLQLWLQPGGVDTLKKDWPLDSPELDYVIPEAGLRMRYKPQQFTQVNRHVNRMMLSRALRFLDLRPGDEVLDLFCGLGNFTLPVASKGIRAVGVEGSRELVDMGWENAKLNGLEEMVEFHVANLFNVDELPYEHMKRCGKWIVDPPRDGAYELVKAIGGDVAPERIVYISCKPSTLARDAGELVAKGYEISKAGIMNMFPHTTHTEAIALFTKR